jgi:hypothetical protein
MFILSQSSLIIGSDFRADLAAGGSANDGSGEASGK